MVFKFLFHGLTQHLSQDLLLAKFPSNDLLLLSLYFFGDLSKLILGKGTF